MLVKYAIVLGMLIGGISSADVSRKHVRGDNSAVNERDRSANAVTADKQGVAKSDTEITRKIRDEIMAHRDLSTYAHNVKVVAQNGVVTLKGPVRSQDERTTIEKIAAQEIGLENVRNEIEIVGKG